MYLAPDGRFVRTDLWREGDYLDMWSVAHTLSGAAVGFGLFLSGFDLRSASVIAFLLFVAYEMFEMLVKIDEVWTNRVFDVIVGMVSFLPGFLFAASLGERVWYAFGVLLFVDFLVSALGWKASHKAWVLEKALRAEFATRRLRLKERRVLLRERFQNRRRGWRASRRAWRAKHTTGEHGSTAHTTPDAS